MESENKTKEVSWNLAEHLIKEIALNLSNASDHFIERKYQDSFMCLKSVAMRITQHLEEDELNGLNDFEEKILLNINGSRTTGFQRPTKDILIKMNNVWKYLNEYNQELMLLLKKYGYLIPPKKDKTNMQA